MVHPNRSLLAFAIAAACGLAHAETATAADDQAVTLDHLTVVGSAQRAAESAGSAAYLDTLALQKYDYSDIQRTLRQVTGVYAVDEEGYGLRPNIGIRGSGTDRNSRITVMEDGVPIAPAVYAAPAAYYFPTAARMSAIEVRKGSSTIRSGPRTTGGTVNLISTPIPQRTSGLVDFAWGTDQTLQTHAWTGGSGDNVGWLLETAQQGTDGFKHLDGNGSASNRGTGYTLEDYLGKFRINTGADARFYQSLEIKLGRTEQDGDETYLGLTDADFRARPDRRYAGSQQDNITTDHQQAELRHYIAFSDSLDLTTVAYENEFSRNWYKLNDVRNSDDTGWVGIGSVLADPSTHADQYAWLTGDDSLAGALRVRNNNRSYYSKGVQSVLGWNLGTGGVRHAFEFGVRYHEDQESRFQDDDRYTMVDGTMVLASDGAPGTQDNRVGDAKAIAAYVQDEIRFGDWIVTPGLRYESIDLTRTDYAKQADGRALGPTRVRKSSVSEWMPGLGVTWLAGDDFNLFASAHKGFNPPGPGSQSDPEESVNVEAGLRWGRDSLRTELVGFWNDYRNLVATCTASSGGGCVIGDQFDGGEARVLGIEASVAYDFGQANGWSVGVPVRLGYTWTDAEFRNSFESDFEEWGEVEAGDPLPYLPEQALNVQVGIEGGRWQVNLAGNYIDDMNTNAADTAPRTESAFVVDLAAGYRLSEQIELYTRIENLTDEVWIASRRPAGARPGLPRQAYLGVRVKF